MRIMEALATKNIKILFGKRWLILENGIYHVFEHKFRKVTDTEIYTGTDEETSVRFLIEGSENTYSPD
jgi:predicted secreted acid phosphatase